MALVVENLDKSRLPKKRKRYEGCSPASLTTIPAEWQGLLAQWIKLGGNSRWDTLVKKAGLVHKSTAETMLDWLLNHGWAVVYEERKHGDWWPYRVELQQQKNMCQQLGLPDDEEMAIQWQTLRAGLQTAASNQPQLLAALNDLEAMPVMRALSRGGLINALLQWQIEAQAGSYRDFSLFARGDTKALSNSEWDWLNKRFDLTEYGILPHQPLLYISADIRLNSDTGCLDLSQAQPYLAMPPAAFSSLSSIDSTVQVKAWICVENLTSFERLAMQRTADTAILWLPGFPPAWWRTLVVSLLKHCPAPLKVACDPDPAGVRIALQAIQLWQSQHLAASPWRMGVTELKSCKHRKPITTHDQAQMQSLLNMLGDLPPALAELLQYMHQTQEKAEQESYL